MSDANRAQTWDGTSTLPPQAQLRPITNFPFIPIQPSLPMPTPGHLRQSHHGRRQALQRRQRRGVHGTISTPSWPDGEAKRDRGGPSCYPTLLTAVGLIWCFWVRVMRFCVWERLICVGDGVNDEEEPEAWELELHSRLLVHELGYQPAGWIDSGDDVGQGGLFWALME